MRGKPWETSMKFDLSTYKGLRSIRRKGIDDVAKAVEKKRGISKRL